MNDLERMTVKYDKETGKVIVNFQCWIIPTDDYEEADFAYSTDAQKYVCDKSPDWARMDKYRMYRLMNFRDFFLKRIPQFVDEWNTQRRDISSSFHINYSISLEKIFYNAWASTCGLPPIDQLIAAAEE